MQSRVGVIVGSLRKAAYTRMLARALPELTPPSLQLVDIGIGDLPLYNYDLETDDSAACVDGVQDCGQSRPTRLLFVTPEFNRSMPGALKNAMDVGSRPWGHSAWDGKPGRRHQPDARRARRDGGESSPAPGDDGGEHRGHAVSGSLHSRRRDAVRRDRTPDERLDRVSSCRPSWKRSQRGSAGSERRAEARGRSTARDRPLDT